MVKAKNLVEASVKGRDRDFAGFIGLGSGLACRTSLLDLRYIVIHGIRPEVISLEQQLEVSIVFMAANMFVYFVYQALYLFPWSRV